MLEEEKRGPGRPRKQERRRRNDIDTVGKRLGVNRNILDFGKFEYRWVNDAPARVFQMTEQDDWDIVKPDGGAIVKDDNTDLGNAVSVVVGTQPDGSPLRAFLCRKPKQWYSDDQKQKQTDLDEQLAQMRRGNDAKGGAQGD